MKKLALAVALTGAASSAFAGGMSAPVVEMDTVIVAEDTASRSTSSGLIVPLIIVALIAAAVAASE